MSDKDKLKQEFIDAALKSDDYKNELPEVKKTPGKAPFIAGAIVLCLIVVLIVVAIGMKEKKGGETTEKTTEKTEQTETVVLDGTVNKVGDYKNFTYAAYTGEITDEDIESYYEQMIDTYATVFGETAFEKDDSRDGTEIKSGDAVNVDMVPYFQGVELSGGSMKAYDIKVGSGSFDETVENSLIGKTAGESFETTTEFDQDHGGELFAGKEITFSITINYISKEVRISKDNAFKTILGKDSLEEAYEEIRHFLTENPLTDEESHLENAKKEYVSHIMDESEVSSSDESVNQRYNAVHKMYESYAESSGATLEDYVKKVGYESIEAFEEYFQNEARLLVDTELVFKKIAEDEGITISEEEKNEQIAKYTEEAGLTDASAYAEEYDKIYGNGSLEIYVTTICIQNRLFASYAKEK